jgi:hypothetical protein
VDLNHRRLPYERSVLPLNYTTWRRVQDLNLWDFYIHDLSKIAP